MFGCGKDDPPLPATAGKSLFSSWTKQGGGLVIDLTGGAFGSSSMSFGFTGGQICTCSLLLSGSEASGTAVLSGCVLTSGASDPGCSSLNGSNNFSKTTTTLMVCDSVGCVTYL